MGELLIILYIAGFLRTILIIVVVYYLIKFVAKLLLPGLVNQAQKRASQQYNPPNQKKEGEVTINTKNKSNTKFDSNDGEYVDFEEVD